MASLGFLIPEYLAHLVFLNGMMQVIVRHTTYEILSYHRFRIHPSFSTPLDLSQ